MKGGYVLAVDGAIPTGRHSRLLRHGRTRRQAGEHRDPLPRTGAETPWRSWPSVPAPLSAGYLPEGPIPATASPYEQALETARHREAADQHPRLPAPSGLVRRHGGRHPACRVCPGADDLDANLRPKAFYGKLIHENCPRRAYFDEGKFAKKFGDEGCLYELGCKGPDNLRRLPDPPLEQRHQLGHRRRVAVPGLHSARVHEPALLREGDRRATAGRRRLLAEQGGRIMAKVTIDPITRIEGHLKIETEVEDGVVKDARSTGNLFRGIELILRGRDPQGRPGHRPADLRGLPAISRHGGRALPGQRFRPGRQDPGQRPPHAQPHPGRARRPGPHPSLLPPGRARLRGRDRRRQVPGQGLRAQLGQRLHRPRRAGAVRSPLRGRLPAAGRGQPDGGRSLPAGPGRQADGARGGGHLRRQDPPFGGHRPRRRHRYAHRRQDHRLPVEGQEAAGFHQQRLHPGRDGHRRRLQRLS